MKRRFHSYAKAVYRTVNAGLLVCIILLSAERFLGVGKPGIEHFIVAFIVLGFLTAINHMTARGRIFCLSALFLLVCAVVAAGSTGNPGFWQCFFPWLAGRDGAPEEWVRGYGLLQTALLSAGCYLVEVLFEKLPAVKTGAAAFLLAVLIFCLLSRQDLNRSGMAFLLCFLLLTWEEWVQKHWEKKQVKESSFQIHTFWMLPFFALYLVLMLVMPAPEEPYDWRWIKTVYHRLQESIHTYTQNIKWGNREGFGMAFTGFSQGGDLGGNLQEDAREIMRVRVQPSSVGYLYLTGTVYDTFDGREWSQGPQEHAGAVFLDTAQTLYAVRAYDRHYQSDYLKEAKVNVQYEDFSTGYVFAPLKTWEVEEGNPEGGIFGQRGQAKSLDDACGDGVLRWNGQKGYGTEYELRYFRINGGQPQFDLFLEAAGKTAEINEAVWREVVKECEIRSGRVFTVQDREDYRKEIYAHYLGEADLGDAGSRAVSPGEVKLSAELESCLREMVEGAETDVEKLRALESALSQLTYTLTPGELPASVEDAGDFLDYFLLESRQGYCTYFATAFVLLAREEGIPARYVQGYCVPIGEQEETHVYSNMAHAWPEVYLKGVGWIPFEPTPGYGGRRYESWKLQQPAAEATEEAVSEWDSGFDPGTEVMAEEMDTGEMTDRENLEQADAESGNASGFSWGAVLFCPVSGSGGRRHIVPG